jgi:hypothetical protein
MKKYTISTLVMLATVALHLCLIRPYWTEQQKWFAFMVSFWAVPAVYNLRLLTAELKTHRMESSDLVKACFLFFTPVTCLVTGIIYRVIVISEKLKM